MPVGEQQLGFIGDGLELQCTEDRSQASHTHDDGDDDEDEEDDNDEDDDEEE